jgi:hypothetical protein
LLNISCCREAREVLMVDQAPLALLIPLMLLMVSPFNESG